jgi:hypothetical protein
MVTAPAHVFRDLVPMIEPMLEPIDSLATYLDEHRDTITFRAGSPVLTDPATRTRLAALMEAAGKAAQASMAEGK